MFVQERMKRNVVTVSPETTIKEAVRTLKENEYEALPVVENDKLVGVLSVWGIFAAMSDAMLDDREFSENTTVREVMNSDPITITPEAIIEEAVYLMEKHDVWALPVVGEDGMLLGIITEWDIYDLFVELLGLEQRGSRITIEIPDKPGQVAAICDIIANERINIISVANFKALNPLKKQLVVRVASQDVVRVVEKIKEAGYRVMHVSQVAVEDVLAD